MDFQTFQNTEPYGAYRIQNTINALSKLNDEQLMAELSKQVSKKKQNGTGNDIMKVINTISPYLNNEQKSRLNNIMEKLK
jgi:uncharacterized protein YbgA (DUF1722 family)